MTLGARRIEAVKQAVRIEDLARDLDCNLRRAEADELKARCPLPDHEDRAPSFTINTEKQVFWRFGCQRGGSVVDLARLVWGYDEDALMMAVADLAHTYGVTLPERRGFLRLAAQGRMTDAELDEALTDTDERRQGAAGPRLGAGGRRVRQRHTAGEGPDAGGRQARHLEPRALATRAGRTLQEHEA